MLRHIRLNAATLINLIAILQREITQYFNLKLKYENLVIPFRKYIAIKNKIFACCIILGF